MSKKEKNYVYTYKGVKYADFRSTMEKALSLPSKEAKEFADGFMKGYRKMGKYADANVGYIIGYYDGKERKKLYSLFKVVHPVFGGSV